MNSIIARLEALEARSKQSIILLVTFRDGSTKEMSVAVFKELPEKQRPGCASVSIVSGNNLKEFYE